MSSKMLTSSVMEETQSSFIPSRPINLLDLGSALILFLLSFPRQCHFDFYSVSFLLQIFSVFPFLLDLFSVLPWPRPIGPLGSALILFPPSFHRQCHFDLYSLSDLTAFSRLPFLFRSFQFLPFLLDLFCIFCLEALFGLALYMHFAVWPHLPLSLFTFTFLL